MVLKIFDGYSLLRRAKMGMYQNSKAYSLLSQQKIFLSQNFYNFGSLKDAFNIILTIYFESKNSFRITIGRILYIYSIF